MTQPVDLTFPSSTGRPMRAALALPADHPLLSCRGLAISPHIGSATHAAREGMADLAVDNLLAALRGERMPNCVNPEVYESTTRPAP